MRNQLGQNQAATGGYANSLAVGAASQAYYDYLGQLNDKWAGTFNNEHLKTVYSRVAIPNKKPTVIAHTGDLTQTGKGIYVYGAAINANSSNKKPKTRKDNINNGIPKMPTWHDSLGDLLK